MVNVRLRYRFYQQSEADDFSDHFLAEEKFRTQDSDLASLSAHTVGLKVDWYVSENIKLDASGDVIFRSDGIDQAISSVGLKRNF